MQDGEASPNPVGYPQEVKGASGKNKLKNKATTSTQSGITFTINDDKTIKVDGTYSTTIYFQLTNDQKISPNTQYTLSGAFSPSCRLRLREYDSSNNNLSEYWDTGFGMTFVSKINTDHINVQIVVYASQTNAIVSPQLEERKRSYSISTF